MLKHEINPSEPMVTKSVKTPVKCCEEVNKKRLFTSIITGKNECENMNKSYSHLVNQFGDNFL